MTHENHPLTRQADMDLLNALFHEESPYPFNPFQPDIEANLSQSDQQFSVTDGLSESEISARSQQFMANVDQSWSVTLLQKSLQAKFADLMPQPLLQQLVRGVVQVTNQGISLADQLVQTVQNILPQWPEEDLQVLARPFAYAMRGGSVVTDSSEIDAALPSGSKGSTPKKSWESLSDLEQARTSLAIACHAVSELAVLNRD
ncbi:MAG: hypothetical protein ACFBSC_12680 [Microcoleaceae cyanobacterium]